MTISTLSAAKTIGSLNNWGRTNLELQKILYIAHMVHLGRNDGVPLINTHFEAWDYGPVVPYLYHEIKFFGSEPVKDIFFSSHVVQDGTEAEAIEETCEMVSDLTSGRLVAITHWEKGAWAEVYQSGVRNSIIPDDLILREYRARTRAK